MRLIFIALLVGNVGFFLSQILAEKAVAEDKSAVPEHRNFGNLQTITERDTSGKRSAVSAKKDVAAPQVSSAPAGAERCELIGPFAELLHAEYLVERLTALEVASSIKQVEIVDGKNYWVYLKPEMSEKEALRRLSEIQQTKAIDSYIIPSGELANGISFGQFVNEAEAKAKADHIRAQGYAAEIKEVPRSHNETWVEVREQVGQKINEEKWLSLLKEEKAIERRQNYCLGVAH
jgi:cell division septation protein DedD